MSNSSHNQGPALEPEERTRAPKGKGRKGSEAPAIRSFVAAAYKGRLANPGYVKACHSKAPEAMVKVVPNPPHGGRVLQLMEYVARKDADEKIQERQELEGTEKQPSLEGPEQKPALMLENQDGRGCKSAEEIKALHEDWAKDFEKTTKNGKTPRHVMHLVFSAKSESTKETRQKVLDAARRVAKKRFSGHKFVLGLHQDGGKPHVHLVVACKGIEKGAPKLRVGPAEIMQLRTDFARELTFEGLKHVATLRKDRPHVQEKVRNGEERLKPERRYWFTGANKEMTKGFKDLDALHKEFRTLAGSDQDAPGAARIKEQIRAKTEALEILVRGKLKEGSKNRAAAFSAMRKVKRDVGLEPRSRPRKNEAQKTKRPTLAEQKATLEAQIIERQAQGKPVKVEIAKLGQLNSRIAAAEALKSEKGAGSLSPWELAQIQKTIKDGEEALKASDMTPEARALAERALNFHKATVAKATEPALAPQVAPPAPEAPRMTAEQPRTISVPQRAPETPKTKPAPSRGFRR